MPYRNAIVVINPEGCPPNPLLGNNCASDRGNTYDRLQSQSWAAVDGSKWEYSESSLSQPTVGRQQKAWRNSSEPTYKPLIDNVGPDVYGVDVIKSPARTRPWTIKDQGIVGVSNMDPFVGTFGLNTNFNGTAKNPTSFFDNARDVSNTKSVAWSYTAGSVARKSSSSTAHDPPIAKYDVENAPASLILGGYDASRFDPSTTVSSSMHSDNRTFTIWLGDIAINDAGKDPQASYQPKLIVDLDFTTPYLSLPNEVCRNMEKSLGLTWDNESRLYFVNDTIHNGLVSRNANISFWIYGDIGKHQFVLSYKSLVLTAKPPLVNQTRKYFAVQRSRGSYFLGRAFLQETYMTAVFDHPGGGYFNLSQANLSDRIRPKIVAIKAADKSNGTADTSASTTQDLKTIIPYIVSGIHCPHRPLSISRLGVAHQTLPIRI